MTRHATQIVYVKHYTFGCNATLGSAEHVTDDLTDAGLLAGRDQVLAQMAWAREYTLRLIDSVPKELWYTRPSGAATHVAWQVGHLAVSQYGLMLFRHR